MRVVHERTSRRTRGSGPASALGCDQLPHRSAAHVFRPAGWALLPRVDAVTVVPVHVLAATTRAAARRSRAADWNGNSQNTGEQRQRQEDLEHVHVRTPCNGYTRVQLTGRDLVALIPSASAAAQACIGQQAFMTQHSKRSRSSHGARARWLYRNFAAPIRSAGSTGASKRAVQKRRTQTRSNGRVVTGA